MPSSGRHSSLAAAHLALAAVTLLFAGWLQSALSPKPWWQSDPGQLGELAAGAHGLQFAGLGYLLATTLCEWRTAVALRRGRPPGSLIGKPVLAAHGVLLVGVASVVARGLRSRALLADLDEWLAAIGVCAALALTLGLWTVRTLRGRLEDDQHELTHLHTSPPASTIPARLVLALIVAAGATLVCLAFLESRPLPHVTEAGK